MAIPMAILEAYVEQHYSKYRNKDFTKSAILSTMAAFNNLRPKYDTFVFSDNTRRDLLKLDGTIRVSFKGVTYNIPICIWLFETYPYKPPICYVRPTQDMMIRPSKYVDAGGRVYLPYLHEWKHPNSDLIGLIQVMTIIFEENSPVYARPANQPPPIQPMTTPYPGSQPPASQAPRPGYPQPMVEEDCPLYASPANQPLPMQPINPGSQSSTSQAQRPGYLQPMDTNDMTYGHIKLKLANEITSIKCKEIQMLLNIAPAVCERTKIGLDLVTELEAMGHFSEMDVDNLIYTLTTVNLMSAVKVLVLYKQQIKAISTMDSTNS